MYANPSIDGLFDTITSGLTKTAKFVTAASNPILSAHQQFQYAKNLWKNPSAMTPAMAGAAPTTPLSNGADLRELQTRLKTMGIDPGPIDGIYGAKTAAAIRQYQARVGMAQDGQATAAVLLSLRDAQTVRGAAPLSTVKMTAPVGPQPPVMSAPTPRITGTAAPLQNGDQIRELQTHLKAMGIDPGPIDGIYGVKTAAGIRQFQGLNNLPQDGNATVGLLSLARSLASVVKAKAPAPSYPPAYPSRVPAPGAPAAPAAAGGKTPAWVIPAAIAGGGLLIITAMGQRRR